MARLLSELPSIGRQEVTVGTSRVAAASAAVVMFALALAGCSQPAPPAEVPAAPITKMDDTPAPAPGG